MNNDLISRQGAIDAIYETFCYAYCDNCEKEMNENLCGDCHRKYQNWAASKKIISKTINELPSAQPEPISEAYAKAVRRLKLCQLSNRSRRSGKWIVHPEVKNVYGGTYIECSQCGEKYVVQHMEDEKYCRNCGAKMTK